MDTSESSTEPRTPDAEQLSVSADDLSAALDELLDTRNAMTRTLLGSRAG